MAESEVIARFDVAPAPSLFEILHSSLRLEVVVVVNPEQVFDVAVALPESLSCLLQLLNKKFKLIKNGKKMDKKRTLFWTIPNCSSRVTLDRIELTDSSALLSLLTGTGPLGCVLATPAKI